MPPTGRWAKRIAVDELDGNDRKILALLQANGKLGARELAERLSLSASPCWRRVKRLEALGVIDRYVAVLDPRSLGLHAVAHVHVSLVDHAEKTIEDFDRFVQRHEQVIECSSITGDADYALKVVAPDAEGLERFMMRELLALGLVRSSTTNFVLRQTKRSTALPLDFA